MEIDMTNVNARVSELHSYVATMKSAKKYLSQYGMEIENSWKGMEVACYRNAISKIEKDMEQAISELDTIGEAISNTANQLKLEELAEQARREAEEKAKAEAHRRAEEEAEERTENESEKQTEGEAEEKGDGQLKERSVAENAAKLINSAKDALSVLIERHGNGRF